MAIVMAALFITGFPRVGDFEYVQIAAIRTPGDQTSKKKQ